MAQIPPPTVWPQTVPFSVLSSGKTDEGLSGTVTVRVNRACQYSPVTAKASSSPSPLQRPGQPWTISGNCSTINLCLQTGEKGDRRSSPAYTGPSSWARPVQVSTPPSQATSPPLECGNGNRGLHKNLSMNVHSSRFIPAENWKQSKCPSTKE